MSRRHRGRRWAALRRRIFERDHYRCTRCGRAGRLEAHHEPPVSEGGDMWDEGGIVTLCRSCHIAVHRPPIDPEVRAWRELIHTFPGVETNVS